MDLQQYDRMKSVLADILRSTQTRLPSRGAETVRDLFGASPKTASISLWSAASAAARHR